MSNEITTRAMTEQMSTDRDLADRLSTARITSITAAAPGWYVVVATKSKVAYPIAAWATVEYPDAVDVEPMFQSEASDGSLTHGFRVMVEEDALIYTYGPCVPLDADTDPSWVPAEAA